MTGPSSQSLKQPLCKSKLMGDALVRRYLIDNTLQQDLTELLPERSGQCESLSTPQLLQSQETQHRAFHVHLQVRDLARGVKSSWNGLTHPSTAPTSTRRGMPKTEEPRSLSNDSGRSRCNSSTSLRSSCQRKER